MGRLVDMWRYRLVVHVKAQMQLASRDAVGGRVPVAFVHILARRGGYPAGDEPRAGSPFPGNREEDEGNCRVCGTVGVGPSREMYRALDGFSVVRAEPET